MLSHVPGIVEPDGVAQSTATVSEVQTARGSRVIWAQCALYAYRMVLRTRCTTQVCMVASGQVAVRFTRVSLRARLGPTR